MPFEVKKLAAHETELAKELFLFYQEDDGVAEPVLPGDAYLRELMSGDSFHVLVAMENGELAGGLTAYEMPMYKKEVKEMFLYEIAVKPAYRQNGAGTALINRLKNICVEKSIDELYVGTTTPNQAAMKLYSGTGGELVADIAWFVYQIEKI
jgi:aminoglycoside 3-N-acetyltransferase I